MTSQNRGPHGPQGSARLLSCVALCGVLLASLAARADSRNDAKRHFREGMALIAAGQNERGIAELKQAYAIKPHPDVLYDIAKAYVDLGNIPEALSYFQRYAATEPDDKEQVLKVMARLTAAVGPAAAGPQLGAYSGAPGTVDIQKLIAQLQALIAQGGLQAPPPQGGTQVAAAKPAPGAKGGKLQAPPLVTAPKEEDMFEAETISAATKATAAEIARELDSSGTTHGEDVFDELVVVAGTRSGSESRVPASITVISDEEIRLSGAASVPEILRRVPGIDVAEMNPSDTNVSMRGFNRRVANKVLVLVDGRSVYQDFIGNTMWPLLDVAVQDISRIEVIRGPGSALYGANAFTGVVNIITKIGEESNGVRAVMQGGTHNTYQGSVSSGGRSGKLSYRTTIGFDRADRWTKDVPDGRVDLVPQVSQPDRSRELQRADFAATYDLGRDQVQVGAGFDNVNALEIFPLGALRTFGANGQAGFARAEIDLGQTRLKAFWNSLRLSSGPEYWPQVSQSLRASLRSDVIDASAQTGFDFTAAGKHHLNIGAGYRFKSVDWGYLAQHDGSNRYNEHHFNAFLQEEWQPGRLWSIILSYRVDRHPLLLAQNITPGGLVQSPRGTILFEPSPDQVLRLTVGSAFRAPTFLESYIDLFSPIPSQPSIGVRFQGDRTLRPEQMLEAELGFRGRIGTFQPDVVVYAERVTNLITDGIVRPPASPAEAQDPVTHQYIAAYTGFQNESSAFLGLGAEVGGKWSPVDGLEFGLNYSFEKMLGCAGDTSTCTSDTSQPNQISAYLANTAQHKANVSALWRTKSNLDLGVDVHFVSAVTWLERSFQQGANGQLGVVFQPYAIDAYTLLNGRVGYRWIKDRLETGVAFFNLLENDDTAHREHPFGNRIGRRVLFTATGSF